MGDCLHRKIAWKIHKYPTFLGFFIPRLSSCIDFDKNGFGYILGDFFTNISGHSDAIYFLLSACSVGAHQGDQIGRIFAIEAIAYFRQFCLKII
jgi:hypothetical protein